LAFGVRPHLAFGRLAFCCFYGIRHSVVQHLVIRHSVVQHSVIWDFAVVPNLQHLAFCNNPVSYSLSTGFGFEGLSGLPDGIFQTKNHNLGKFKRVLQYKIWAYLMAICYILRQFDIFYGRLENFLVNWYIFPALVYCTKRNLATQGLINRGGFRYQCLRPFNLKSAFLCGPIIATKRGGRRN
jgi:hypothetical protein